MNWYGPRGNCGCCNKRPKCICLGTYEYDGFLKQATAETLVTGLPSTYTFNFYTQGSVFGSSYYREITISGLDQFNGNYFTPLYMTGRCLDQIEGGYMLGITSGTITQKIDMTEIHWSNCSILSTNTVTNNITASLNLHVDQGLTFNGVGTSLRASTLTSFCRLEGRGGIHGCDGSYEGPNNYIWSLTHNGMTLTRTYAEGAVMLVKDYTKVAGCGYLVDTSNPLGELNDGAAKRIIGSIQTWMRDI